MNRLLSVAAFLFAVSASQAQSNASMSAAMDRAMTEHFTAEAPGGAALVAQGGKVLYERAIGMADLSKYQPLSTKNQFRIGSVTKQFTAVAILQLAEAGKLKLDDEIQKCVDFPKKEQPITIAHLLTHTSGIQSFTSLPGYTPEAYAKDVSLPALIAQFADLPLEFPPGTSWNYSNSGYILLTAILEKASGERWADYASKHLFTPAGMTHTSATSAGGLLPDEAIGYSADSAGWKPANPISMTWPMGAGNIRSTVEDLWKWNAAVFAGKLVSKDLLAKAHQAVALAEGNTYPYGFGWMFQNVQGSPTAEHGGGIDGFVSESIYLPKEDIYVTVLVNREGDDAGMLAPILAAIALGKPYGGEPVPLSEQQASEYSGVYVNAQGVERYITVEAGSLHAQRQGSEKRDLTHFGQDRFIYTGDVTTLTFQRTDGKVSGARFLGRRGEEELTRSDKPLPTPHQEMKLSNAQLQAYVGEFAVVPGMTMTFRAEGDRLFVKPTGNEEAEVFAEAPHRFFLKVVDATMEFHPEADGTVKRMTYTQGKSMECVRVK